MYYILPKDLDIKDYLIPKKMKKFISSVWYFDESQFW